MHLSHSIRVLIGMVFCLLLVLTGYAKETFNDKHIEVSLRMIGHQILLNSGDSTSRVLPIIKEKDWYSIHFESEFSFVPEELVNTINQVIKEAKIADSYIVEVENCESKEVVYSFEMNELTQNNLMPCNSRFQPKSCYSLLISLNSANRPLASAETNNLESTQELSQAKQEIYFVLALLLAMVLALLIFFWRRNKNSSKNPDMIPLGKYQFDKKNNALIFDQETIELSGKESDLLKVLYDAANKTTAREDILKKVWGDEGDYIGRTLDVFISKLRKKLLADSNLKIINIRGVGYKLVVDR